METQDLAQQDLPPQESMEARGLAQHDPPAQEPTGD